MAIYLIAAVTQTDPQYEKYISQAQVALAKYPNEKLVSDNHPVAVEGSLPGQKIVVARFEDEAAFEAFWYSDEYKEAAQYRHLFSDTGFVLTAKSLDHAGDRVATQQAEEETDATT